MRVEDYFANGKRWWVRLHEKGGKRHEMPAHHKFEAFLNEYIRTAGIVGNERSPLFRSAIGRTGVLAATAKRAFAGPEVGGTVMFVGPCRHSHADGFKLSRFGSRRS
jgi:hypothetical protein